jgi:uncharacterized protein involved in exopolysaccharide biosynthesis
MNAQQQFELERDHFNVAESFEILWRKRWQILVVTVSCGVLASLAAFLLPKRYKASVLLSAVSTTNASQLGGMSSLVSQIGGFASLAGLSVGGDSKKAESIAVLQSEALTERYIREHNLLPILYEGQWDKIKAGWKSDDPKKIPTLWKANQYFKKSVRFVGTDTKTGLVTLTITWKDPQTAAKWANDLVEITNDYLRGKAIAETDRDIAFLTDEALKTNVVEAKQAIYRILESEISKGMLARGSNEYAFKILDPAVAPDKPSSPIPFLWISAGIFGGLLLSSAVVLLGSGSRHKTSA